MKRISNHDEMVKTVFEVRCWWDVCPDEIEKRYVVAKDEQEVNEKMEQYSNQLVKDGFAKLHWFCDGTVEMNWVIC